MEMEERQWIYALKLSHMWGFEKIREMAIQELETGDFDVKLQLMLSMQYDVDHWYRSAIAALVRREQALTLEESHEIGLVLAVRLARVRERRIKVVLKELSEWHYRFIRDQCPSCRSKRASLRGSKDCYSRVWCDLCDAAFEWEPEADTVVVAGTLEAIRAEFFPHEPAIEEPARKEYPLSPTDAVPRDSAWQS